jgi:hypothetical protein
VLRLKKCQDVVLLLHGYNARHGILLVLEVLSESSNTSA